MSDVLNIIQGISQAVSNIHHGARDAEGEPIEIGLRREKEGFMDGFNVSISGNRMRLNYESEIHLKEVYEKKFENEIIGIMDDCISFIKKEYKKVTKKTLSLKRVDEPVVKVEHINRIRSWVTAYAIYEISGLDKPEELGDTWQERLNDKTKKWLGIEK